MDDKLELLKCIYDSDNYIVRQSNKKFIITTFSKGHFCGEIAFKILENGEDIKIMFEN